MRGRVVLGIMLLAVSGLVPALANDTSDSDKQKCIQIHGEYVHYNGWPPYERIRIDGGKKEYGLASSFEPDADFQPPNYPRPDSLALVWDANDRTTGEYLFCLADRKAFVPYLREPIELGWIKSFKPDDSGPTADFIREIKIAVINAKVGSSNSGKSGGAKVSFDYVDGVSSNAKIEQSSGSSDLDNVAIEQVTKAAYPKQPSGLQGKTLHITLKLYFPPDPPLKDHQ